MNYDYTAYGIADTTLTLLLIACVVCGVLWLLADHFILTPRRIAAAQAEVERQFAAMRNAAGIHPGMPRKMRRAIARSFAKKMVVLARVTGETAGMPRHEVRRRQKALALKLAHGGR